ncbi:thioredoxin-dependent thiol peroxidase [Alphaproteobacteria bacterium]|nr:thioredoxin-dependent thiol peroxidase [Alphaproteobacteria bacterium]
MKLKVNSKAPNFKLPNQEAEIVELYKLKKNIILFFYPKDSTPGCTKEAISFSNFLAEFNKLNCLVFGISKDSIKKHQNFIQKSNLLVNLLSDEDQKVCESYGVWVEKSMYGRKYMGIERTTILINNKNKILNIWPKVKVPGHVEEVLEYTKNNLS